MKKPIKHSSAATLKNEASKSASSSNIDFKIILIIIAYLLIDFLPYFKSIEIIYTQFFYLSVLNVFVVGFIYFNPRQFDNSVFLILRKNYIFWAYLIFTVLCLLSVFAARNVSLSVVSIVHMLVVFGIFINLSIVLRNRMHLLYTILLLLGISAFFQASQALIGLKQVIETQTLVEALESSYLKGNTGNINIFAASVLIKLPFVLAGIFYFSGWRRWFLSVTLALVSVAIFLISARASLLSFLIILLSFIVFYIKSSGVNKNSIFSVLLGVLLPILVAFGSANLVLKKSNIGGRYSSTTDRLKTIQLSSKDRSINLRYLFWKNAINFSKEKPLMGIGLGNWRVASIPYEPEGGLDISLHTHNDFLEIATETGVVNALIYLSLFFVVLIVNAKTLLKSADQQSKLFAFLALMLLVVYGIDSVFNFPMYRPTMKIGFCLMLIITIFNRNDGEKSIASVRSKIPLWLSLGMIVPIYFTYHGFKTAQLERAILLDNANIESKLPTALSGDSIVKFRPKYPNVLITSDSFIEHAAVYYIYEKKYELAKKYLDSADKINPYLATPDFLRYYIAVENGKTDSAYYFIKKCFYKRPSVERNFKKAIEAAAFKKDTLELFKMYRAIKAINDTNASWDIVYAGLQNAGLSSVGLEKFIKQGLADFPKDSVLMERQKSFQIFKHLIKGQQLYAAGQHVNALLEYKKGLTIDPTNVFVMQNIGFYYYNLGQTEQAISYFLKALQKPGLTGGQTEFYLAQCYLKNNNTAKACPYLQIAQTAGFAGAAEALAKFCK
jgi:O-antigen ligase/tetratricopeptide (TPR) repeat protein